MPPFDKIALVGIGLIGSSLARVARRERLAGHIAIATRSEATLARAEELGLGDSYSLEAPEAVRDADLVIVSVPVGASGAVAAEIAPALKKGAIVTDVGSTKQAVIEQMRPHIPGGVHFIPGHPIAGTEKSGPDAGFPELFAGRYEPVDLGPGVCAFVRGGRLLVAAAVRPGAEVRLPESWENLIPWPGLALALR